MKTRVIHTKLWSDEYIRTLNLEERFLFFWLISNGYTNILNFMEVSDDIISIETQIPIDTIKKIKEKLINDGKIDVYKNYIYLTNGYKYQTYSGIKNVNPKLRLIYEMSDDTIKHFSKLILLWLSEIELDLKESDREKYEKTFRLSDRVNIRVSYLIDTPIHNCMYTPSDTGQNTEYKNQNLESKNKKTEELDEDMPF